MSKAHKFLIDKGILNMYQPVCANVVEKWMDEYAAALNEAKEIEDGFKQLPSVKVDKDDSFKLEITSNDIVLATFLIKAESIHEARYPKTPKLLIDVKKIEPFFVNKNVDNE